MLEEGLELEQMGGGFWRPTSLEKNVSWELIYVSIEMMLFFDLLTINTMDGLKSLTSPYDLRT